MRILSPNGRLNRLQYFLQSFGAAFVAHAIVAVFFVLAMLDKHTVVSRVVTQTGQTLSMRSDAPASFAVTAALAVVGLLCSWILLVSQVKRLHDLNQSGWLVLINLIPGAGLVMWLILVFAKGEDRSNTYGFAAA
ncbi:MAG: DUF805 domain-containing protein [Asticcacaulis sp.]|nr:DUF805 domain-containing protein [Asticcacaulis sp.]